MQYPSKPSVPDINEVVHYIADRDANVLILHHSDNDGYAGAAAIHRAILEKGNVQIGERISENVTVVGLDYGPESEDASRFAHVDRNWVVVMVDFSLDYNQMQFLQENAGRFVCLDHHSGVPENIRALPGVYFDNSRSGALLGWDWSHGVLETGGEKELPYVLAAVNDRDLWKNPSEERDAISCVLNSVIRTCVHENSRTASDWTADLLDVIYNMLVMTGSELSNLIDKGKSAMAQIKLDAMEAERNAITTKWLGHPARIAFSQTHDSDIGQAIYTKTPDHIAMIVSVKRNGDIKVSMRSHESLDLHLGELARNYFQGGGHKNAAGFRIPQNRLGDLLAGKFKFAAGISTQHFVAPAIPSVAGEYRDILSRSLAKSGVIELKDRYYCESDASFFQLLPYIRVRDVEGRTLTYRRPYSGDEPALHAMHSIGYGGHMDDMPKVGESPFMWVIRNAGRELVEELNFDIKQIRKDGSYIPAAGQDDPSDAEIMDVVRQHLESQLRMRFMYAKDYTIINKLSGVDRFHLGLTADVTIPASWILTDDNAEAVGVRWMSDEELTDSLAKTDGGERNPNARKWESWTLSMIAGNKTELITD